MRRLVFRMVNAVKRIGRCEYCYHDPFERFCKQLWSWNIYDAKRDRVLFTRSIETVENAVLQFKLVSGCLCPKKVKEAIAKIFEYEFGYSIY